MKIPQKIPVDCEIPFKSEKSHCWWPYVKLNPMENPPKSAMEILCPVGAAPSPKQLEFSRAACAAEAAALQAAAATCYSQ